MPHGQQLRVAIGMGSAAAVATIVLVLTTTGFAGDIPRTVADRLIFVGKADLFVALWLALSIANVARLRFFSPQDIGGSAAGGASIQVHNATAILQNTLEQVVLAVPVHLALVTVTNCSVSIVAALVGLFSVGRICFWIGYAKGAPARAFGFGLTFYPTLAALFIAVFYVVGGV